jgi:hypothetical protein
MSSKRERDSVSAEEAASDIPMRKKLRVKLEKVNKTTEDLDFRNSTWKMTLTTPLKHDNTDMESSMMLQRKQKYAVHGSNVHDPRLCLDKIDTIFSNYYEEVSI